MGDDLFICIHGHFYQPPRENPWLETIDYQESAQPYHDWNFRINAECYRPNGLSRILDQEGWVQRLSNNYSRISFNFGPTLLSWIEENDPQSYASIIEGDKKSLEFYGGHGSALAQAYNHIIMPLANRREKETQVKWGLADFRHRFGRDAEGMWIPETAVDLETLEVMADQGMKFVVLAPRQAQAVRPLSGDHLWESVRGERINIKKPYLVRLPNGSNIAAFFYDGPISRSVAFEGLLNNGETFASRLCSGFEPAGGAQLVHIATDGESYGHHHLKGDMALSYALDHIERKGIARLTNYAQFLEMFPPADEVMIYERSSWSCIHGVERWTDDCGCNSGAQRNWNQKWRKPLREAFDFLRDALAKCYESSLQGYTDQPWDMHKDYISIILDRSEENRIAFLNRWLTGREITAEVQEHVFKALEMQRQSMLMYTSCAWFFDELSGIETVQALSYAARGIELGHDLCGVQMETDFLRILEQAPSNIPAFGNGKIVYEQLVKPMRMDFLKVATHMAAHNLFNDDSRPQQFSCFDVAWPDLHRFNLGKAQTLIAHLVLTSQITRESKNIEVVAFHLGDNNLNVGVRLYKDQATYDFLLQDFSQSFDKGGLADSLRLFDRMFEGHIFYIGDLRHEQQKEIIDSVLSHTLLGLEEQFTDVYEQNHPAMNYLSGLNIALPPVLSHLAHFVQNKRLKTLMKNESFDFGEIERYLQEAKRLSIDLDREEISRIYIEALKKIFRLCKAEPDNKDYLERLARMVRLQQKLPFEVDLGEIQNAFAVWSYQYIPVLGARDLWKDRVVEIADVLKVRLPL